MRLIPYDALAMPLPNTDRGSFAMLAYLISTPRTGWRGMTLTVSLACGAVLARAEVPRS
jgi:hypothetical protein